MDQRICYLRVLACFMVITLHISASVFVVFDENWWAGNVYDSLVRSCVPIFFMIAGATLLPKSEPIETFFHKRVLRIFPPLIFWSIFYLSWLAYNNVATGNWLLLMISGPTMYHLWYLYAVVGIYLFVPVLRKFFQNTSDKEQIWFIATWIMLASIIPTLQNLLFDRHCEGYIAFEKLGSPYYTSNFAGYIGYLMLGAYLSRQRPAVGSSAIIFAAGTVTTIVGTYLLSREFGRPCEFLFVYFSLPVVAAAYGVFALAMSWAPKEPSRLLRTVSDCTLGIYGLHVFAIDPLLGMTGFTLQSTSRWISIPLAASFVFGVCLVIIITLRRVKPLRHIL